MQQSKKDAHTEQLFKKGVSIVGRLIVQAINREKRGYFIASIQLITHLDTASYQYFSFFFIARDTCFCNILLFS